MPPKMSHQSPVEASVKLQPAERRLMTRAGPSADPRSTQQYARLNKASADTTWYIVDINWRNVIYN